MPRDAVQRSAITPSKDEGRSCLPRMLRDAVQRSAISPSEDEGRSCLPRILRDAGFGQLAADLFTVRGAPPSP